MYIYISVCVLYSCMMILVSVISKLNFQLFNYSPLNITLFYVNVFFVINIWRYDYSYGLKNILKIDKKHIKKLLLPSVVNAIETVIIYWGLLYVPMSFYIIGRTFSAFVNVLFSKYYLKKSINVYYYFGLIFLLISYGLFMSTYKIKKPSTNEILSIIFVFVSGITTSFINNSIEKFFDEYDKEIMFDAIDTSDTISTISTTGTTLVDSIMMSPIEISENNDESDPIIMSFDDKADRTDKSGSNENISIQDRKKSEMQMIYQVVFGLFGFLFVMPVSLGLAISSNDFTTKSYPNIIYAATGICNQMIPAVKIIILSYDLKSYNNSKNQILTGVDLLRRILTNIISYVWFDDFWNVEIIFANVMMVVGCCVIAFSTTRK